MSEPRRFCSENLSLKKRSEGRRKNCRIDPDDGTGRTSGHHEIAKQRSPLRSIWIAVSSTRRGGKQPPARKKGRGNAGTPRARGQIQHRSRPNSPRKGQRTRRIPILVLEKKTKGDKTITRGQRRKDEQGKRQRRRIKSHLTSSRTGTEFRAGCGRGRPPDSYLGRGSRQPPAGDLAQSDPPLLPPAPAKKSPERERARHGTRGAGSAPISFGQLGDADGRRRGGEGGRKRTGCPLAYSSAPSAVAPSRRAAAANYTRRERGEEAAAVCDRCNDAGGAGRGQKEQKLPLLPLGSSAEPGRAAGVVVLGRPAGGCGDAAGRRERWVWRDEAAKDRRCSARRPAVGGPARRQAAGSSAPSALCWRKSSSSLAAPGGEAWGRAANLGSRARLTGCGTERLPSPGRSRERRCGAGLAAGRGGAVPARRLVSRGAGSAVLVKPHAGATARSAVLVEPPAGREPRGRPQRERQDLPQGRLRRGVAAPGWTPLPPGRPRQRGAVG
ncbi:hypothetical protein PVAP13_6NG182700 [Panicum virgatum]|uniref:Uncharacterized protein n=1 Tax=Panicum virgatum TaxID=38727 RepID=A0A8T0QYN5_PANVG|nr:hypothetical protein PVAP13_6NG182700 [Panicum virgatum]